MAERKLALLQEGIRRGAFSEQTRSEWPQNIWAVTERDEPVEAQHEGGGAYHGYPMPMSDPFREKVLERWRSA